MFVQIFFLKNPWIKTTVPYYLDICLKLLDFLLVLGSLLCIKSLKIPDEFKNLVLDILDEKKYPMTP